MTWTEIHVEIVIKEYKVVKGPYVGINGGSVQSVQCKMKLNLIMMCSNVDQVGNYHFMYTNFTKLFYLSFNQWCNTVMGKSKEGRKRGNDEEAEEDNNANNEHCTKIWNIWIRKYLALK